MPMSDQERYRLGQKVTLVGAGLNLFLALLKVTVGFLGRSHGLVADGVHSFADLLSDFLVLVANRFGMSAPDKEHPYGHGRIETLATVVLAIFLIGLGVGIGIDAMFMLIGKAHSKPDYYTVIAAVISVLVNEGLFRYTLKVANLIDSDLLRANAWHSRSDSLSSLIVLAGLIGAFLGWPFLDGVAAIIVALMIIKMGVKWGWRALEELIDTALPAQEVDEIATAIRAVPGVQAMHDLRTRKMAADVLVDVHILIDPFLSASEGHYIAEKVREALLEKFDQVRDITVHVDVEDHGREPCVVSLPSRCQIEQDLLPQWRACLEASNNVELTFILHYWKQQIKIDLYVPNELAAKQPQAWVEKLQATVVSYPGVSALRVLLPT